MATSTAIYTHKPPAYISPPGATLQELLDESNITQRGLAARTGLTTKTVNEIVSGAAPITATTAVSFERVLRTPAKFWLTREANYRAELAILERKARLDGCSAWVEQFPFNAMSKLGWVASVRKNAKNAVQRRAEELLRFFAISEPEQWAEVWLNPKVAFRKSLKHLSDATAVSVWLRAGEREAAGHHWPAYSKEKFKNALKEVRKLTIREPSIFGEEIRRMCGEAGVSVILQPQVEGAKISGASFWLTLTHPVIMVSLRYKTDDQFWFTFYHEAVHIVKHQKSRAFIHGSSDDAEESTLEVEANRIAGDLLIPPTPYKTFVREGVFYEEQVRAFAADVGIAPGVVVGRLQRDGLLAYKFLNHLKVRLDWR